MLRRQTMEALTLQATQTRECDGEEAPFVPVTFRYPLIFDQAMRCFPEID